MLSIFPQTFSKEADARSFLSNLFTPYASAAANWNLTPLETITSALMAFTFPQLTQFTLQTPPFHDCPVLLAMFMLPIPPNYAIPILKHIYQILRQLNLVSPLYCFGLNQFEHDIAPIEPYAFYYKSILQDSSTKAMWDTILDTVFVTYPKTSLIWSLVQLIVQTISDSSSLNQFTNILPNSLISDGSSNQLTKNSLPFLSNLSPFISFPEEPIHDMQVDPLALISGLSVTCNTLHFPTIHTLQQRNQLHYQHFTKSYLSPFQLQLERSRESVFYFRNHIPPNLHALLHHYPGTHFPTHFALSKLQIQYLLVPSTTHSIQNEKNKSTFANYIPSNDAKCIHTEPQTSPILWLTPQSSINSQATQATTINSHHATPLASLAVAMLETKSISMQQFQFMIKHGISSVFIHTLPQSKLEPQHCSSNSTESIFQRLFHPSLYPSHTSIYPVLFLTNQLPQKPLIHQSPLSHLSLFPLFPLYNLVTSWILHMYPKQPVNEFLYTAQFLPQCTQHNPIIKKVQNELSKYIDSFFKHYADAEFFFKNSQPGSSSDHDSSSCILSTQNNNEQTNQQENTNDLNNTIHSTVNSSLNLESLPISHKKSLQQCPARHFTIEVLVKLITQYLTRFDGNDDYFITIVALFFIIQQIPQQDCLIYPYFAHSIPFVQNYAIADLFCPQYIQFQQKHTSYWQSYPSHRSNAAQNNISSISKVAQVFSYLGDTPLNRNLADHHENLPIQNLFRKTVVHSFAFQLIATKICSEFEQPQGYDGIFQAIIMFCSDYISAPLHFSAEYVSFLDEFSDILHLPAKNRETALDTINLCQNFDNSDKKTPSQTIPHNLSSTNETHRLSRYQTLSERFEVRNQFSLVYYLLVIWNMEIHNVDLMMALLEHTNQFELFTYPRYDFKNPTLATMNQLLFTDMKLAHSNPEMQHINEIYLSTSQPALCPKILNIEPIYILGHLLQRHYPPSIIQFVVNIMRNEMDSIMVDGYGMSIIDYCLMYHYYQPNATAISKLHKQYHLQTSAELVNISPYFELIQTILQSCIQQISNQHTILIPADLPKVNIYSSLPTHNDTCTSNIESTIESIEIVRSNIETILKRPTQQFQLFFMDIYRHNRHARFFPDSTINHPILTSYDVSLYNELGRQVADSYSNEKQNSILITSNTSLPLSHPRNQFSFPSHITFTIIDDSNYFDPGKGYYDETTRQQYFFFKNAQYEFHRQFDHFPPHLHQNDPTMPSLISPTYNINILFSTLDPCTQNQLSIHVGRNRSKKFPFLQSQNNTYHINPQLLFTALELASFYDTIISSTHSLPLRSLLHKYFVYLPAELDLQMIHIQSLTAAIFHHKINDNHQTDSNIASFTPLQLIQLDLITWPYLLQLLSLPNLTQSFTNQQFLFDQFLIPFLTQYLAPINSIHHHSTPTQQLSHFNYLHQNTNKYLRITQFDIIYAVYCLIDNNFAPTLVERLLLYISPQYYYYLFYFYTLPLNTHNQLTSSTILNEFNIRKCGQFEPEHHCLATITTNGSKSTGIIYTQPMYPFSVRGISCHDGQQVQMNGNLPLSSTSVPSNSSSNPTFFPTSSTSPTSPTPTTPIQLNPPSKLSSLPLTDVASLAWTYPTTIKYNLESFASRYNPLSTQSLLDQTHLLPAIYPHINSRHQLSNSTSLWRLDRKPPPRISQPAEYNHCDGYGFVPELQIHLISSLLYLRSHIIASSNCQEEIEKNLIYLSHCSTINQQCDCTHCINTSIETQNTFTIFNSPSPSSPSSSSLSSIFTSTIPHDFQCAFSKLSSIHPITHNISPTLLDLIFTKPNYIPYFYLLLKHCSSPTYIPLHQITSSIFTLGTTYYTQFLHLFIQDWQTYKGQFHSISMLSTPIPTAINFSFGKDKRYTLELYTNFHLFQLINQIIIPLLAPTKIQSQFQSPSTHPSKSNKINSFDALAPSSYKKNNVPKKTTTTPDMSNPFFPISQIDTINTIDIFHMSIPAIFIYLHYHYPNPTKQTSLPTFLAIFFLSLQNGASPNHLVPFPQTPVSRWMAEHIGMIKTHPLCPPSEGPIYINPYVDPSTEIYLGNNYYDNHLYSICQPSHSDFEKEIIPKAVTQQQLSIATQAFKRRDRFDHHHGREFRQYHYRYFQERQSSALDYKSSRYNYFQPDDTIGNPIYSSTGSDYQPSQVPKPYWNILFYIIFECCWQSNHVKLTAKSSASSNNKKKGLPTCPYNYLSHSIPVVSSTKTPISTTVSTKTGSTMGLTKKPTMVPATKLPTTEFEYFPQIQTLNTHIVQELSELIHLHIEKHEGAWFLDQTQLFEQIIPFSTQLNEILIPLLLHYYTHPTSPFHANIPVSFNTTRQFKYTTPSTTHKRFSSKLKPYENPNSYTPSRYVFHDIYTLDINQTFPLTTFLYQNKTFSPFFQINQGRDFVQSQPFSTSTLYHVHIWHLIFVHTDPPLELINFLYKFNRTDFSQDKDFSRYFPPSLPQTHFHGQSQVQNQSSSQCITSIPKTNHDHDYDPTFVDDPFDTTTNNSTPHIPIQYGTALQLVLQLDLLPFRFSCLFRKDSRDCSNLTKLTFNYTPTLHYNFFSFLVLRCANPKLIQHVLNLFYSTPTPTPILRPIRHNSFPSPNQIPSSKKNLHLKEEYHFEEQSQIFHTAFKLLGEYQQIIAQHHKQECDMYLFEEEKHKQRGIDPHHQHQSTHKAVTIDPIVSFHHKSNIQNRTLSVFDLPFDHFLLSYLHDLSGNFVSFSGTDVFFYTLDQFIRSKVICDIDPLSKDHDSLCSCRLSDYGNIKAHLPPTFDMKTAFAIIAKDANRKNILHPSIVGKDPIQRQHQQHRKEQETVQNQRQSNLRIHGKPQHVGSSSKAVGLLDKEHTTTPSNTPVNKKHTNMAFIGPKQSKKAVSYFGSIDPLDLSVSHCIHYTNIAQECDDDDDYYDDDQDYYDEDYDDEGYDYQDEDNDLEQKDILANQHDNQNITESQPSSFIDTLSLDTVLNNK